MTLITASHSDQIRQRNCGCQRHLSLSQKGRCPACPQKTGRTSRKAAEAKPCGGCVPTQASEQALKILPLIPPSHLRTIMILAFYRGKERSAQISQRARVKDQICKRTRPRPEAHTSIPNQPDGTPVFSIPLPTLTNEKLSAVHASYRMGGYDSVILLLCQLVSATVPSDLTKHDLGVV